MLLLRVALLRPQHDCESDSAAIGVILWDRSFSLTVCQNPCLLRTQFFQIQQYVRRSAFLSLLSPSPTERFLFLVSPWKSGGRFRSKGCCHLELRESFRE